MKSSYFVVLPLVSLRICGNEVFQRVAHCKPLDGHVEASILTCIIRVRLLVVCRQLWKQELNTVLTATYWERYVRSTILLMRDEGG